ncbi:MAG TPA: phosphoglucosamine mutase [Streptosporangiaceae bacterium]
MRPEASELSKQRLFGTDGVRGVAGRDLTARLAMDLSVAAARVLGDSGSADPERRTRPVAVVGRDPRASGEFLEAAVVAGLASQGVDVLRLGVLPTPGVAYLTGALAADFGVVISASHNPAQDNGIKFFGAGGVKLPDAVEDEIEAEYRIAMSSGTPRVAGDFGRVSDAGEEQERYLDHLQATIATGQNRPLAGLKLVVDCAHGAAYRIAPRALRRAGADVIPIGVDPDGLNINQGCGSTALDALAEAVIKHDADAGIAYDGDADRCLAVDEHGEPLDGDQILTVLATELKEAGRLAGDGVVVTVMSNQGFHATMRDAGIAVIETPVGDKHVSAAMRDGGYVLGGEQSGHIIMLEHATTGDGVLTSLHLLAAVNRRGLTMAAAAQMMPKYPQVLVNVPGDGSRLGPGLDAAVSRAESQLGGDGRVIVRPSGTEPKIRLMVQARDAGLAERVIGQLADAVRLALADS